MQKEFPTEQLTYGLFGKKRAKCRFFYRNAHKTRILSGKIDTSSAGHIQAGDEPLESALRELKEELGIHAESADLQFAGKFPISFAREFHGKIFRDEEIAFVSIYDHPVEINHLTLQKEEVEEVQWFDLEEVYEQCGKRREIFCVPEGGLGVVRSYLKSIEKN